MSHFGGMALMVSIGSALIACTLNLQQLSPPNWLYESLPGRLMWSYADGGSIYIVIGAVMILIGFLWKTLNIKLMTANPYDELAFSTEYSPIRS